MATSVDPVQDISDGISALLKPAVERIDHQVHCVRESQFELRNQLEAVRGELQKISEEHFVDIELEPYIQRLLNTKRKLVLVSNIVQNVEERVRRLLKDAEKEAARHKAHVEAQRALLEVNIEAPTTSNSEASVAISE